MISIVLTGDKQCIAQCGEADLKQSGKWRFPSRCMGMAGSDRLARGLSTGFPYHEDRALEKAEGASGVLG